MAKRERTLGIRVTEKEYAVYVEVAAREDRTVSDWLRLLATKAAYRAHQVREVGKSEPTVDRTPDWGA